MDNSRGSGKGKAKDIEGPKPLGAHAKAAHVEVMVNRPRSPTKVSISSLKDRERARVEVRKPTLIPPPAMAATIRPAALLLLAVGCGCATGLLTPARLPGVSVCTSPQRVAQAPRACALPSASPPPSSGDLAAAPSATAVEDAVPSRGPRPELSPMEVVQAQLALFRSAEEEDLDQCWSFFSPYGPTYDVRIAWHDPQPWRSPQP
eukprot:scaffold3840_cov159-Isochrysis_galbana.AAC.3